MGKRKNVAYRKGNKLFNNGNDNDSDISVVGQDEDYTKEIFDIKDLKKIMPHISSIIDLFDLENSDIGHNTESHNVYFNFDVPKDRYIQSREIAQIVKDTVYLYGLELNSGWKMSTFWGVIEYPVLPKSLKEISKKYKREPQSMSKQAITKISFCLVVLFVLLFLLNSLVQ